MGAWDAIKTYGGYALNPSLGLSAATLGQGGGLTDAIYGNRFDQAQQYGASDRNNFNMPGYDAMQGRYNGYLGMVDARGAPQAQGSAVAGDQRNLAGMLGARARGEGSVAELQLRQATDQGMRQQQAMAAGARPGSSAMAARLAGQNMGRMQAGLGQAAAIARAQEANQAAGQLGGLYGQMRGQDENMSQFNAQMGQQQMALNDQARNNLLNQSLGAAQGQQQGGIAYEQIQGNKFGAALGVPTQQEVALGTAAGVLGAGLGGR